MRQTCSCPFQNFLYPELHDPADQVVRNWFIEWKSYRSLSSFITGQLFFEFLTLPGRGIKPDMFFVGGKINQIPAFQIEGRYFIADRLFCARRRFSDSHPYLFQNLLNGGWEARNVLIYVSGRYFLGSHLISPYLRRIP